MPVLSLCVSALFMRAASKIAQAQFSHPPRPCKMRGAGVKVVPALGPALAAATPWAGVYAQLA